MLRYENVLKFALIPSILYLLLSLVSVALTTHYWILTDWVISRGVRIVTSEFDDRTNQFVTDATIVYFTDTDTDTTIVSGCLNLAAAVIAVIAWSTLRKPGMDTVMNSTVRRFWILSIVVMAQAGAVMAIVSLAMHYTKLGDDKYGCTQERLMMGGSFNTNIYCTREMAVCRFQPEFARGSDKQYSAVACNEAVTVKWMQILLAILGFVVLSMFSLQAYLRRTTRESRIGEKYVYGAAHET
jgi:ABC-type multidrug transport system fused ATPase/permease subunit